MSYKIEFVKSAVKEFRKLLTQVQKRAEKVLQILQIDPFSDILRIRKIRGRENLYRIRVSSYRIIYAIENDQTILIVRIRHRKEVYENL